MKNENSNNQMSKKNGLKFLGCIGKTCALFLFLVLIRTCGSFVGKHLNKEKGQVEVGKLSNKESFFILQENVQEMNKSFPQKIDEYTTAKGVELNVSIPAFEYQYVVDDNAFMAVKSEVLSKSNQLAEVKSMYSDMKPLIDLLVQARMGLSYVYTCKKSQKSYRVDLSYEDLLKIKK